MKKIKKHKAPQIILSAILLLLGIVLLSYMIICEGELGALPLAISILGITLLIILVLLKN